MTEAQAEAQAPMTPEVRQTLQATLDYFSIPEKHAVCTYFVAGNEPLQLSPRWAHKGEIKQMADQCEAMCVVAAIYTFAPDKNVANGALTALIPNTCDAEWWNNSAVRAKANAINKQIDIDQSYAYTSADALAEKQNFRDPDAYKMVTDRIKEVLA